MWIPLAFWRRLPWPSATPCTHHLFHNSSATRRRLATDAVRLTPQPGVFHIEYCDHEHDRGGVGHGSRRSCTLGRSSEARALAKTVQRSDLGAPYLVAKGKFFWDEIYDLLIVAALPRLASFCYGVDRWVVDGLVNLSAGYPRALGSAMRGLQMGSFRFTRWPWCWALVAGGCQGHLGRDVAVFNAPNLCWPVFSLRLWASC